MKRECETCIKRKTPYCPTSIECMATDDKPYYQDRIMILEENKQLRQDYLQIVSDNCDYLLLEQENKQLKSIIYELREHMLDIDYKMGWQYVEYLDRLLPEKILKEMSHE